MSTLPNGSAPFIVLAPSFWAGNAPECQWRLGDHGQEYRPSVHTVNYGSLITLLPFRNHLKSLGIVSCEH